MSKTVICFLILFLTITEIKSEQRLCFGIVDEIISLEKREEEITGEKDAEPLADEVIFVESLLDRAKDAPCIIESQLPNCKLNPVSLHELLGLQDEKQPLKGEKIRCFTCTNENRAEMRFFKFDVVTPASDRDGTDIDERTCIIRIGLNQTGNYNELPNNLGKLQVI